MLSLIVMNRFNTHIKSRTKNILNKGDTSAIVENKKASKITTEKYFGTASSQTTNVLSFAKDSF